MLLILNDIIFTIRNEVRSVILVSANMKKVAFWKYAVNSWLLRRDRDAEKDWIHKQILERPESAWRTFSLDFLKKTSGDKEVSVRGARLKSNCVIYLLRLWATSEIKTSLLFISVGINSVSGLGVLIFKISILDSIQATVQRNTLDDLIIAFESIYTIWVRDLGEVFRDKSKHTWMNLFFTFTENLLDPSWLHGSSYLQSWDWASIPEQLGRVCAVFWLDYMDLPEVLWGKKIINHHKGKNLG